jgi:hypothetical protein
MVTIRTTCLNISRTLQYTRTYGINMIIGINSNYFTQRLFKRVVCVFATYEKIV